MSTARRLARLSLIYRAPASATGGDPRPMLELIARDLGLPEGWVQAEAAALESRGWVPAPPGATPAPLDAGAIATETAAELGVPVTPSLRAGAERVVAVIEAREREWRARRWAR